MGSITPSTSTSTAPARLWTDIVADKRAAQTALLKPWLLPTSDICAREPRVANVADRSKLADERLQGITEIGDVEVLAGKIAAAEYTAEEVSRAYIMRAVIAHQLTNCLTEINFEEALSSARALDTHLKTTGTVKGPLHGVPITLKDQFNVTGLDTTLGYVGRSFKPATEDALIVSMLRDLGAVIIAKTNLPQSIMWCETDNPLWGLTTNPRDPDFTPGGSTGGESALLALHGSIAGLGTDIGGSVRIPQNMMGGYGFKPSSGRLPYRGVPVSTEGQEHVPSTIGIMTRTLSSTLSLSKALISRSPWLSDPRCAPLAWRDTIYDEIRSRPLVIGLMLDDGVARVHPPIQRYLEEIAAAFTAAGHTVIPWDNTLHTETVAVIDKFYTADGGEDIRRDVAAAGEPFIPHVQKLVNRGKPISVYEYWQLNREKVDVQMRYADKWNGVKTEDGRGVDVLLTPTMAHCAVPHGGCRWIGYTKHWNVLDYTTITLPVGHIDPAKDNLTPEQVAYQPRNEFDEWNWKLYDIESMAGHPVSVQIVGRKLEEEKVLAAAEVLEEVRKK